MNKNYVLIDFENVQPESIAVLDKAHFNVLLFVGQRQSKVSIEIAASMQAMGERAQYVRMANSGKNALDFHIAYYIGRYAASDADAFFHIISQDTGFDPLIAHLKTQGVTVIRSAELTNITPLKALPPATPAKRADIVVAKMKVQASRPRTLKTLTNHVHSLFQKKLGEEEVAAVIKELKRRKHIVVSENKVTYSEG